MYVYRRMHAHAHTNHNNDLYFDDDFISTIIYLGFLLIRQRLKSGDDPKVLEIFLDAVKSEIMTQVSHIVCLLKSAREEPCINESAILSAIQIIRYCKHRGIKLLW